uniref:Putative ovule protein n=1 Tax=Solanum chacoense TaxID=4108 RepID=A0A0V0GQH3_SOLCH
MSNQRRNNRIFRPYCNYCNRPGHTPQSCWKLHGRPPRTNNRSTTHIVQTHKDTNGQLANSITLSGADYSDYLQYQAATRQSPLSGTSQNGNSFACLTRSSPTCPWILDSGASDHISGNQNLFSIIIHYTTLSAVTLANGSRTAVNGIGNVQLLPSIP